MKIFVFKTDIKSHLEISILASALRGLRGIVRWSVDMHDVDRVLKIVTLDDARESELVSFVKSQGVSCESLPD
ncbi:MAG: hypothetical protein ABJP45_14570 [Cyclobacteriaceae bacterium]